jgi:DNA-directed RNA polymerase subunit RPC12/RpoP
MDEAVAPPEQQQSPELVALPGNPQRPEVALARCGQCGRKIAYPKRLSGKRVRCPSCKSGYVLP